MDETVEKRQPFVERYHIIALRDELAHTLPVAHQLRVNTCIRGGIGWRVECVCHLPRVGFVIIAFEYAIVVLVGKLECPRQFAFLKIGQHDDAPFTAASALRQCGARIGARLNFANDFRMLVRLRQAEFFHLSFILVPYHIHYAFISLASAITQEF